MATCFPVLGVPRSGTSCVAGILHRLGVFMGEKFYPPNEANPTGFYMDLEFEELFDSDFMPQTWSIKPVYATKLIDLVKRRMALGIDWGFKASKTALLVGMVEERRLPVKLIITQRSIAASKASLARWELSTAETDRILSVASSAISACRQAKVRGELIVDYDLLVTNPAAEIAKIAAFVGKPLVQDAVDFVDETARHFV